MSSSYYSAQLEEMRREELREKLDSNIDSLIKRMSECNSNSVGEKISFGSLRTQAVVDELCGKFGFSGIIATQGSSSSDSQTREGVNLSGLLSVGSKNTAVDEKIVSAIEQLGKRAILSSEDLEELNETKLAVNEAIDDSSLSIEQKHHKIRNIVNNFLQAGTLVENVDLDYVESTMKEYRALCEMLSIDANETLLDKIEVACDDMREKLQKRQEDEFIAKTVADVMMELGCENAGNMVLQQVEGELYKVSDSEYCDVFVSNQGTGILFEPVVDKGNSSQEHLDDVQSDINKVCRLYAEAEKRLKEHGIILTNQYYNPVVAVSDSTSKNAGKRKAAKPKKRRKRKLIEKELGDE